QTRIVNYLTRSDVPDEVKQKLAFQWEAEVGGTVEQNRETAGKLVADAITSIESEASANEAVYIEQLKIIQSKVDDNVLFSLGSINTQIDAIRERFDRMHAFETTIEANDTTFEKFSIEFPNSLDGNASMESALESFLEQEARILDAQKQRLEFASRSDSIDLPNLVAGLQISENIGKEILAAQNTLELEQNNELVKYYAEIQRMVNEVQKDFNSDKPEEERDIFGKTGTTVITIPGPNSGDSGYTKDVTDRERTALKMFDEFFSGTNVNLIEFGEPIGHPMEDLNSITRPTDQMLGSGTAVDEGSASQFRGLPKKTQAEWNLFATQLADAVTLINQRTQILTNDITSLNQEGNRHFEQMNNALRRSID
ncbi:MAG: hypothetical protein ABJN38_11780, partial [Lentilitoribacter sp.]